MNKMFELVNSSHRGFFIVAKDREEVLKIGKAFGMYNSRIPDVIELPCHRNASLTVLQAQANQHNIDTR